MALLFQRIARNFEKLGYFPTDSKTLALILAMLTPSQNGKINMFDPCCGEGVALAECKAHFGKESTHAYGIELDAERATQAKQLLDTFLQADFMDCIITPKSMGLLFLNPPYGDLVQDHAELVREGGRKRLEKVFYQHSVNLLQPGGVMVLIIPYTTLDYELAKWLGRHFDRLNIFLAPEQRYHQCVIIGVRANNERPIIPQSFQLLLKKGVLPAELPSCWLDEPYLIPSATAEKVKFASYQIDPVQLAEVTAQSPCLWTQFDALFTQATQTMRRSLLDLSRWHLALTLAAGQVTGIVSSSNGQRLLIKGDTHKLQVEHVNHTFHEDGSMEEIRTRVDHFVPVIRAIDVTPSSPSFGKIFTIG